jgi:hypothetical protein
MALTKEDGTIVAGANTFCTLAEIRSFATARGVTLSAVDATLEALAIRAMDYMVSKESRFQGSRYSADQELPFPREGVVIYGQTIAVDAVPKAARDAQCALCMAFATLDLMPVKTGVGQVIRKKVGELETEWAKSGSGPSSTLADSFLELLYGCSTFSATTVRV